MTTAEQMPIRPKRPLAFVVGSTVHGMLIYSPRDRDGYDHGLGVGAILMEDGEYDSDAIVITLGILQKKKFLVGDGVVALDIGANIGVYTVEWARLMHGWGEVHAFEPQRPVYYALAGNIAINNCFNADAQPFAIGAKNGLVSVPRFDYTKNASFSGVTLRDDPHPHQPLSAAKLTKTYPVKMRCIDSFALPRVDLMKIDVEGMEGDVVEGARGTIERCRPVIFIEHIWTGPEAIQDQLGSFGYECYLAGPNQLCIHRDDPMLELMKRSQEWGTAA